MRPQFFHVQKPSKVLGLLGLASSLNKTRKARAACGLRPMCSWRQGVSIEPKSSKELWLGPAAAYSHVREAAQKQPGSPNHMHERSKHVHEQTPCEILSVFRIKILVFPLKVLTSQFTTMISSSFMWTKKIRRLNHTYLSLSSLFPQSLEFDAWSICVILVFVPTKVKHGRILSS